MAKNKQKLVSTRIALKGHLTRITDSSGNLVSSEDLVQIKTVLGNLDSVYKKLNDCSNQLYELLDDEEDPNAEIQIAQDTDEQYIKCRTFIESIISKIEASTSAAAAAAVPVAESHHSSNHAGNYHGLPKLELPSFDGDFLEYRPFIDQFNAAVHNREIPDVQKFTYLRSCMKKKSDAESALSGLESTACNYKKALTILKERFGDAALLIGLYATKLVFLDEVQESDVSGFRQLIDSFENYWREIQHLIEEINPSRKDEPKPAFPLENLFLSPILTIKLPSSTRREWARRAKTPLEKFNLENLISFVKTEIDAIESIRSLSLKKPSDYSQKSFNRPHAAFFAKNKDKNRRCLFCTGKNHTPFRCFRFKSLDPIQRHDLVRSNNLCGNCLGAHKEGQCKTKSTCLVCGRPHHTLLHPDEQKPSTSAIVSSSNVSNVSSNLNANASLYRPSPSTSAKSVHRVSSSTSSFVSSQISILQTGSVRIRGYPARTARFFLDTGAELSYVTQQLVDETKPCLLESKYHRYESFGGSVADGQLRNIYFFELGSRHDDNWIQVRLIALPKLSSPCSKIPCSQLENLVRDTSCLNLAEDFMSNGPDLPVDILLGMDVIPEILLLTAPRKVDRLLLTPTIFGFIVGGTAAADDRSSCVSVAKVFRAHAIEESVSRLWNLETVGISPPEKLPVPSINPVFDGDRYQVSLPWLDDARPSLSLRQAELRASAFIKLSPERRSNYTNTLRKYHDLGILENAEPLGGNFIPHHAVFQKGKDRIVYDASATAWKGPSLNDCLQPGPNLLADLTSVLLRFRCFRYPLTGDIEKAFLMVGVRSEDRHFLKIFWYDDDMKQRVSRFTRVCFGINCGPFLLLEVIRYHLSTQHDEDPEIIKKLMLGIYMDDEVSGGDSPDEVIALKEKAEQIYQRAGMNMRQFTSLPDIQKAWDPEPPPSLHPVLGLEWLPHQDNIRIKLSVYPADTKRKVASEVASIFDPLGLASPWTIRLRSFLQTLWKSGTSWDDPLDNDSAKTWLLFCRESYSTNIELNRHIPVDDTSEMHVFGDASEMAYACVIYIRTQGQSYLLCSKSRVAPSKPKMSIPRLELLAATLCCRLAAFARNAMNLSHLPLRLYSDSSITLAWISGTPTDVFVRNRIQEIRNSFPISCWFFIQGQINPADIPSRGAFPSDLGRNQLWRHGPFEFPVFLESSQVRLHDPAVLHVRSATASKRLKFPIDSFSNLDRAVRTLGWWIRFRNNALAKVNGNQLSQGRLTPSELGRAKLALLKDCQREHGSAEYASLTGGVDVPPSSSIWNGRPSLNKDGVIVCSPRTGGQALPWLPLPSHLGTLIIQDVHHQLYHMGVSTTVSELLRIYWINPCRRFVKKIITSCISCRKIQTRRFSAPEGGLPLLRTTEARPFERTGLDHFGPIKLRDGSKTWCLLFTCAITRAVHLELVSSLDVDETKLALRRFFARRGVCSIFFSDNGTSFVALKKLLNGLIEWRLIPPAAPWWGGFWERMVGTIKRACKKTLGNSSVTHSELNTILVELEDRINRRPLCNAGDEDPLTPAHFLFFGSPPPLESSKSFDKPPDSSPEVLTRLALHGRKISSHLWSRWKTEYLTTLRNWRRRKTSSASINVGDVVIIAPSDGIKIPRSLWPLGLVMKLHPGADGMIRAVDLRIKGNRTIQRPLQRLFPLECSKSAPDVAVFKPEVLSAPTSFNAAIPASTTSSIPSVDSIEAVQHPQANHRLHPPIVEEQRTTRHGRPIPRYKN